MGTSLYSLEWAQEVVEAFHAGNARATDLVMKILHISELDLLNICRSRGNSFNNFKAAVKRVERGLARQEHLHSIGHGPKPEGHIAWSIARWALGRSVKSGEIRNKKLLDILKNCDTVPSVPNERVPTEVTEEGTQLLLGFMNEA